MKNLLLITFLLLLSVTTGFADNIRPTRVDGICYSVNDDKMTARVIEAIHFNGEKIEYTGDIVIPDYIAPYSPDGKYKVIEIAPEAFQNDVTTSVEIPGTVDYIPPGCFLHCENLRKVTFNLGVQEIGHEAFMYLQHLESVVFKNTVTSDLTNGKQGTGCTIGFWAFYGCKALTSVEMNHRVSYIGSGAFTDCCNLKNISNASRLYCIEDYAFSGCSSLEAFNIGDRVNYLGDYAFRNCTGLENVVIGSGVTHLGYLPFEGCTNLTSVSINSQDIFYSSYNSSRSLVEVLGNQVKRYIIGDNVTYITDDAFEGCSGMTSITIGSGVTDFGFGVFQGCSNLTSVTIRSNAVLSASYHLMSKIFGEQVKEYIIGETVTTIGDGVFSECSSLTSITIPKSVTSIGLDAFSGCSSLATIKVAANNPNYDSRGNCNAIIETKSNTLIVGCMNTIIPNSVVTIGEYAFNGSCRMTEITIPESVTTIGERAFYNCSGLTSIYIHENVRAIGECAFQNCSGLEKIVVASGNPNYDSRNNCNAIIETSTNTLIAGCKNTIIPEGITSIGKWVFCLCEGLTSITIPESVNSIGEYAFHGCSSLTSVTVPNSVTSIGDMVFYGCSGLISPIYNTCLFIYMPTSYEGHYEIPNEINTICGSAFSECSSLTSVTIPNSVTSIGKCAFWGCTNLKDVYCNATNPPIAMHYIEYSTNYGEYLSSFDSKIATLHVPASAINAYKTTKPWSGFITIVALPDSDKDIEINTTNFPDENFRNWLFSQDYGKDGLLTEEEIASVTEINVSERGIQSLKGIEYFTALQGLSCASNQLTELDLSKNTALTALVCFNNQLTELNLSGHTELGWLNCHSNQLTMLDVTGCTPLRFLCCYKNQIKGEAMDAFVESLPTVSNHALDVMFFEDEQNEMTVAQVAAAKAKGWTPLAYICDDWSVPYAGIDAVIDGIAINATNFPDVNFRNWLHGKDYAADGMLTADEIAGVTSIEIWPEGSNLNIQSLRGIEYFTSLTDLYCTASQLTELDVSKNIKLTVLNCSDNQLTSLNVSGCTELIRLLCYNNHLTELNVSGCTTLNVLGCYQNQINDEAMDALIESLPTVNEGSLPAIHSENEQNVMTALQVEKAKVKGWKVYAYTGVNEYGEKYWQEYAGNDMDPDGIIVFTLAKKGAWYDLQGRKQSVPQKGINIILMSDGTTRKAMMK